MISRDYEYLELFSALSHSEDIWLEESVENGIKEA